MTGKVDMSLEDIIKSNKIKPGNRRGGGGGSRGNRGAGRGRGIGIRRGGQTRGRQTGGRPFMGNRSGQGFGQRGNVEGRWNHDMYQGGGGGGGGGGIGGGGGGRIQQSGPAKLLISNLDFGVSDSDIHELFAEFGTMRSAAVHYDRSGRSLGTAHVSFERHADAIKALKQYNGVQLDGRPMNITMDGGASSAAARTAAPVKRLGQGPRPISGGSFGGGRGRGGFRGGNNNRRGSTRGSSRGGRGRGGVGGRGGRNQVVPTAEELDAELDAYVNQVNK